MLCSLRILLPFAIFLLACLGGCASQGPTGVDRTTKAELRKVDVQQQQSSENLQRAEALLSSGEYQKARAYYEKLLAANAEVPDRVFYDYGFVLNRTEDFSAAIEQFRIYTELAGPTGDFYPAAMQEWAFAKMEQGRLEEQKKQQAEEEARQRALAAAQRNQKASPAQAVESFEQAVMQQAAGISEPLTGMELALVRGSCYQMGDHFGDGDPARLMLHEVCVSDFYIGKYEVTQGQWQQVMGYNPAFFNKGEQFPVEMVSWLEVQTFLELINQGTGQYRLPTEAEWEFAARSGGKLERFSGGPVADAVAWYQANSTNSTNPVGQKQGNGLGLFDMSGNVAEWCLDYADREYYQVSPKNNPMGPATDENDGRRMSRGGHYRSDLQEVTTSYRRSHHESEFRSDVQGFRLVLPLGP